MTTLEEFAAALGLPMEYDHDGVVGRLHKITVTSDQIEPHYIAAPEGQEINENTTLIDINVYERNDNEILH